MNWKNDLRHSQEMEVYADEIYRFVFPIKKIVRYTRGEDIHVLDKHYHIDCILTLQNKQILTLQEKFLRERYHYFNSFTLEYHQNRSTGELGEWGSLCTDLYFTGYGEPEKGFTSAYLFKTIEIKLAIIEGRLCGDIKKTSTSKATFYAFPFEQFKKEWFIYHRTSDI